MERVIKKALLLVLCFTLCLCTALFVACDELVPNVPTNPQQQEQTENEHICSFGLEKTEDKYLKSSATCQKKAVYYKSCSCGKASDSETFEYGTFVEHKYVDKACEFCGKKQPSEGLEFDLLANGTGYAVTGIGTCTDTDLVIPETYNDLPVTSIDGYAFSNCASLVDIYIPEGVTAIDTSAFRDCVSLENLRLPNSVTEFIFNDGEDFNDCMSLKFSISDNLYYIGNESNPYLLLLTANPRNLTTYNINENCKFIYAFAFYCCTDMTSIIIPNSVIGIGGNAFLECKSLENVTLSNNLKFIGENAFEDCYELNLKEYNGAYYLGSAENDYLCLIDVLSTDITTFDINENCKIIYGWAFYDCSSLTNVTIPDGVTSIGYKAFADCASLASITIPDGVTRIEYKTFADCTSLANISIPDSVTSIGDASFYNCISLTDITIPSSIASIGVAAFYECSALTKVNYTGNINQWVHIKFGDTTDPYRFYEISNPLYYAKKLYINDELVTEANITTATKISDYAFYGCTSLEKISIGNSVSCIGEEAFEGCTSLQYNEYENAYYLGNTDNRYLCLIGLKSSDITSFIVNDNCKFIYGYVFSSCRSLESITIPNSVTSIGKRAFPFYYSGSLEKVNYTGTIDQWTQIKFSDSCSNPLRDGASLYINDMLVTEANITTVTKINDYAFYGCNSLESITIGNSVTSIGDYAFGVCKALVNVVIPENVICIGEYSFVGCKGLKTVTIGNGVAEIGESAFCNCDSLESVTIGVGVKSIGRDAFNSCNVLNRVNYEGTIDQWVQICFDNDSSNPLSNGASLYIKGVMITEANIINVTEINSYVFIGCDTLESVTIGVGVKSINGGAFKSCNALTKVNYEGTIDQWVQIDFANVYSNPLSNGASLYINDVLITEANITNATKIEGCAFSGCSSLTSVTIGNSVTNIDSNAFSGCSSLNSVTFDNFNEWYVCFYSSATSGTNLILDDTAQNATYLTDTYCNYYWKRG